MMYYLKVLLVIIPLLILGPVPVFCDTYTETIDFDSNQAYTDNTNWMHSLSQIPQEYIIRSARIELRVQVLYWGWNTNEQNINIMASDTTSFTLPQDRICELNSVTNPNSSSFYTVTCQISSDKLEFINNDRQIYIGTNTYGGTYYLDYSTLTVIATQLAPSELGIYDNGVWYVDLNGNGMWDGTPTDALYYFGGGLTAAVPVTGNWTGTSTTKIGVYADGVWYLDLNGNGIWDGTPTDGLYYFGGGLSGAVPVTGDWTGTGGTRIGVYADGVWYLDLNGNGIWDGTPTDGLYYFGGGLSGAVPVTGDWTGTGGTRIGVYADGVWYLDLNGNGIWDGTPTDGLYYFGGGLSGAVPVTGDWTGTGGTRIGVYADGVWYARSEWEWSLGWNADRWSLLFRRRSGRSGAGCRQTIIV